MSHSSFNILSRRSFLDLGFKTGVGAALASLMDIPPIVRQALADGNIDITNKKVLFIFLRGANDALNSVIPVEDPAYYNMGTVAAPVLTRPVIGIAKDPAQDYTAKGVCFDATRFAAVDGTPRQTDDPVFSYTKAISLGNGYAGLHPSLKFLAPVMNAGHLALIHRVAYPKQSRSHFDSQNFWENGAPYSNVVHDGIFYRTMVETGLAPRLPLTGVSVQRSLPMILRGSAAAMTNLTSTDRYALLGLPSVTGRNKSAGALKELSLLPSPEKKDRELLALQYQNLSETLSIFDAIRPDFTEAGNVFRDDAVTDGDQAWFDGNGGKGYYLFPTHKEINGGWQRPKPTPQSPAVTDAQKYVVPPDGTTTDFFTNLKAAAIILNKTGAVVAGTQLDGFDTHSNQGSVSGQQPNLLRRIGWAMYALRKYFSNYADRAQWKDVVVVTLTEFGRTTVQNSDGGTDHAEAGVMWVAGGSIKGGVYGCSPADPVPWTPGPANQGGGVDGSMFGVQDRYLKRAFDYRSVLGEIIRKHLGASQTQLEKIIPGYADKREQLLAGGTSGIDGTKIIGEPGILI